ncbi:LysM domain-containing protein [Vibrio chagasii]|nr:LysM domain-containing protein [Vibrio chagasii]
MRIYHKLLSVSISIFSIGVYAQESPFQVSGGLAFSTLEENMVESESLGYQLSFGYNASKNLLFEIGYADFSAFSERDMNKSNFAMFGANLLLPVSDYASIYAGSGGAISKHDTSLTATIGVKYKISSNWYADFSYQKIFGLESNENNLFGSSDLYAFNTLLEYRFPNYASREHGRVINENSQDITFDVPVNEKVQSQISFLKEKSCKNTIKEYTVVQGDFLYKIARKFDVSLNDIIKLNPKFNTRNIDLIYPDEKIFYETVCY